MKRDPRVMPHGGLYPRGASTRTDTERVRLALEALEAYDDPDKLNCRLLNDILHELDTPVSPDLLERAYIAVRNSLGLPL